MYFVRNNEEIHLSFKNSEKQRTQALSFYIFTPLTYKKLLLSLQSRLKPDLFFDTEELKEYLTPTVIVVSSNCCVGPLPRTKIYFFILLVCCNEPLSTPKITFLPKSKFEIKKSEYESNPIPYLE